MVSVVTEGLVDSPLPKVHCPLLAVPFPKHGAVPPALANLLGAEAVVYQRQSCHSTEVSQKSYFFVRQKEVQEGRSQTIQSILPEQLPQRTKTTPLSSY